MEEAVKAALSESGVYAAGMDPRVSARSIRRVESADHRSMQELACPLSQRTLFCSTTLGRASISRQLAPHVHVDGTCDYPFAFGPALPSFRAERLLQLGPPRSDYNVDSVAVSGAASVLCR